ncbi:MAG: T9SS type A sorting domain-containing protein [Candidatus Tenebribacter burtonii]|jgi:hypothetical protein|nr:T9SS type A sorting domain-containing protein [Candidatus Tenebribacter burtonii]
MKKIVLVLISMIIFSGLYAINVASLLDLYNVRDGLNGDYTQTANIDLAPTNQANVSDWETGTYSFGNYVKHGTSPNYTYICINIMGTSEEPPHSDWKQLWDSSKGWDPIGNNEDGQRFLGSYNGDDYTISNLFINRPSEVEVGLFGCLGWDGTEVEIKNLGLLDVEVAGGRGTGSLVGRVKGNNDTRIEFCFARNGTVVGDGATGGLVGSNNSYQENAANAEGFKPVISKCYAHIDVSWSREPGSGADKFGGLVGCNQKGITQFSYALGSVTVDNDPQVDSIVPERIGGLAGCTFLRGRITNSYSAGSVTTTGSVNVDRVGGLVGYVGLGNIDVGTVNNSFWDTETSGQSTSGGGTGHTTSEMKTQSTFTNWDFTNTWKIVGTNYPCLLYNPDPTLPVILSSFTAQYIENKPTLYWITQTESNNLGWNVYRSISQNLGQAILLNVDELIEGSDTTTEPTDYTYVDMYGVEENFTYYYWIESVSYSGETESFGPISLTIPLDGSNSGTPNTSDIYGLYQNYPNPFNPSTLISFALEEDSDVELIIYNVKGEKIKSIFNDHIYTDQVNSVVWDGKDASGKDVASGVYFYKLITDTNEYNKKMLLVK